MHLHQSILHQLADLPRWVEVRDLLATQQCEILAFEQQPELSLVLRDLDAETVFVLGQPDLSQIQAAMRQNTGSGVLITSAEQTARLVHAFPEWVRKRILVHTLPDTHPFPIIAPEQVGFLDLATLEHIGLPEDLFAELQSGAAYSPIATTFVMNEPVSFCYAGATTESWWDVAIDTLPQHRRRGYATRCATYMIGCMQTQRKQPVWQALEDNQASQRLAQKLGFRVVDELVQFGQR